MITYRQAETGDESGVASLHSDVILGYYKDDYPAEALAEWSAQTPEKWRALIESDQSNFFLALDGNVIIGCAGLNIQAARLGVYVRPHYHCQGIAEYLMRTQLDKARTMGLKTINLAAPERAVGFYEKIGFQYLGPERNEFKNGSAITVHTMKLDLS